MAENDKANRSDHTMLRFTKALMLFENISHYPLVSRLFAILQRSCEFALHNDYFDNLTFSFQVSIGRAKGLCQ